MRAPTRPYVEETWSPFYQQERMQQASSQPASPCPRWLLLKQLMHGLGVWRWLSKTSNHDRPAPSPVHFGFGLGHLSSGGPSAALSCEVTDP